jgi:hypothetical protein
MAQVINPTFLHGKETELFLCEFDITCFVNNIDLTQDIDLPEVTTFCDSTRRYINGLRNATGSIGGFIDDDADTGIDAILQATFNLPGSSLFSDAVNGFAVGNRVYLFRALINSYNTTQPVDGVQGFTADLQLDGDLSSGFSLHANAAETVTGVSAGVDLINQPGYDGAVTSVSGFVAHLHVCAASGTTPTLDVEIEDSADDMTYAAIGTGTEGVFAQATAPTCERLETSAGAFSIDEYVRSSWVIAGTTPSFTFVVAYAPKPS